MLSSSTSDSDGRYKYGRAVNSFMFFLPNIDGDPGILILYSDAMTIHQALGLSSVAAIPHLNIGKSVGTNIDVRNLRDQVHLTDHIGDRNCFICSSL